MKLFSKKKKSNIEEEVNSKVSNPFIVQIENTSSEAKPFVLFGSNRFLNEKNFGNSKEIKISYLGENTPYASILTEMLTTSYKIGLIRVQSNNSKNIRQTLGLNMANPNVGMYDVVFEKREIKLAIMMDAYQMQSDIIDVRLPNLKMDKHYYFSGQIEPNSILVISIFPTEIISSGILEEVKYKNARISGTNVAPVIIHTTSRLKRLMQGGTTFLKKLKNLFKKKK